MSRIMVVAVDGGAVGALKPVAQLLKAKGHDIQWVVQKGSVAEDKNLPGAWSIGDVTSNVSGVLGNYKPDLVLTSTTGNDVCISMSIPKMAMDSGIPVVKVVSFYGTGMPHERGFAVDRLCVIDDASIAYEAKMRGMSSQHIFATGGPQFDKLPGVEPIPALQFEGHTDGPLVVFVGPSSEERVLEIYNQLLAALRGMIDWERIRLGVLWHPKSNPGAYATRLEKELAGIQCVRVLNRNELLAHGSMPAVMASARLIIGATSNEIVSACHLRVPVISCVPQGGVNHQMITKRDIEIMPTSAAGASLHAENADDMYTFLKKMINNDLGWEHLCDEMHEAQKAHFSLDGENAARVMDVVDGLLREAA